MWAHLSRKSSAVRVQQGGDVDEESGALVSIRIIVIVGDGFFFARVVVVAHAAAAPRRVVAVV